MRKVIFFKRIGLFRSLKRKKNSGYLLKGRCAIMYQDIRYPSGGSSRDRKSGVEMPIAHHLGQSDEAPNVQLAYELVQNSDTIGISEIAAGLDDQNEKIAADCLKVLYEVSYRNPMLVSAYRNKFISLLRSKNNRMIWGASIALAQIAPFHREALFHELDEILEVYRKGSVITVDNCIRLFAEIAIGDKEREERIFPILIEHLSKCRPKEIPQHAESIAVCVTRNNFRTFKEEIEKRCSLLTDLQKKRVGRLFKILKKRFAE